MQKNQEQAAKRHERHCVFRKSPTSASQAQEAPERSAPSSGRTSPSTMSVGTGEESRRSTPQRQRPSFGSSVARPCCR
jgi:hypothetical protein